MSPESLSRLNSQALEDVNRLWKNWRLSATGNPAEWAKKKRYFAPGETPVSRDRMKFTFHAAPWCEEPSVESVNPDVQMTILWMGSNTGKTSILLNVIGYTIDEMPGGTLVAYKTQEQADKFSKNTFAPAVEATPALNARILPPKSRDSSNTISAKKFPGGYLSFIGTESITGFRLNRAPVVIGDEIDSWEGKVGDEGDPVTLLLRRSDGFPQSIRILASTGTIKGHSRIDAYYSKSDMRKWLIPCLACGARQLIRRSQIQWAKGRPETAVWLCEECGRSHNDHQRQESVRNGIWTPHAEFVGIRGYWLNGYNSLFPPNKGFSNRLHQWAQEITDAAHAADKKESNKVIIQTLDTELWQDEEDERPDWAAFAVRRQKYAPEAVPGGVVRVTAGIDVQLDRLEAEIVGFGRAEETWGIRHIVIPGDPAKMDFQNPNNVWNRMEAALVIPLKREDGKILPISAVGVDTSEPTTKRAAWAFVAPRQAKRWFAMRGSSLVDHVEVARSKRNKVDRINIWMVGTNRLKGQIYERALIATPGPSYMHIPESYTDEWCKQLFAESSFPVWKSGVRWRQFECPKNTRNEALDMRVYAIAAFIALGPTNWEYEEQNLQTHETPKVVEATAPAPQHQRWGGSGGFVGVSGGWKM